MCNRTKYIRRLSLLIIILFGVFTVISSGGGDGDGNNNDNFNDNNNEGNVECVPTIDVNGTWFSRVTIGENDCNFPVPAGTVSHSIMLLAQNGSSLSELINGTSGELCGNSFTLSDPENMPEGYNFTMTGSGSSTSLSGTKEYNYPLYGGCSGTDTYTADKSDDWFDTATPITLPYISSDASFAPAPKAEYYTFTTNEAGIVEVAVDDTERAVYICLFDDFPNLLRALPSLGQSITYYSEGNETFYVMVAGFYEESYTLNISPIEPNPDGNDTFDNATSITLPYTSSGTSIDTSTDKDYYKFTTTGPGSIYAQLSHDYMNLNICLYDTSQRLITCDPFIVGSPTEGDETFYVEVTGINDGMSDYTLTVSYTSE